MDYSPWGRKESDTTERLHFFLSLNKVGRYPQELRAEIMLSPRASDPALSEWFLKF